MQKQFARWHIQDYMHVEDKKGKEHMSKSLFSQIGNPQHEMEKSQHR